MINIIYHDQKYFAFEPWNDEENPDNIIDNHLWLILKFMPKKGIEVKLNDVLRFGRIPFKITSLVLNVKEKERFDMI